MKRIGAAIAEAYLSQRYPQRVIIGLKCSLMKIIKTLPFLPTHRKTTSKIDGFKPTRSRAGLIKKPQAVCQYLLFIQASVSW